MSLLHRLVRWLDRPAVASRRTNRFVPRLECADSRIVPAVHTWDGGGGANQLWSNAANWEGDNKPLVGEPNVVVIIRDNYQTEMDITGLQIDQLQFFNLGSAAVNLTTPLSILGGGTFDIVNNSGVNTITGSSISLESATCTIGIGAGALTISSNVGGNTGIQKFGAGELRLTGATSYTGTTTVAAGSLSMFNLGVATTVIDLTPTAPNGVIYATVAGNGGTFISALPATGGGPLATVYFQTPAAPKTVVAQLFGTPQADRFDLTPVAGVNFSVFGNGGADTVNLAAAITGEPSGLKYITSPATGGTFVNVSLLATNTSLGSIWFQNANPPAVIRLFGTPLGDQFDLNPLAGVNFSVFGSGGGDVVNFFQPAANGGAYFATSPGFGGTFLTAFQQSNNTNLGSLWFQNASPPVVTRLYGTTSTDRYDLTPVPGTNFTVSGGGGADIIYMLPPTAPNGALFATHSGFGGTFLSAYQRGNNAPLGGIWFPGDGSISAVQVFGTGSNDQFDITPQVGTQLNMIGNGGTDVVNVYPPSGVSLAFTSVPINNGMFYYTTGPGEIDRGKFWVFPASVQVIPR